MWAIILDGIFSSFVGAILWFIATPIPFIILIIAGCALSVAASRYTLTNWPAWVLGIIMMLFGAAMIFIRY